MQIEFLQATTLTAAVIALYIAWYAERRRSAPPWLRSVSRLSPRPGDLLIVELSGREPIGAITPWLAALTERFGCEVVTVEAPQHLTLVPFTRLSKRPGQQSAGHEGEDAAPVRDPLVPDPMCKAG